ncbi:hypothetical protein NLX67_15355 [Domibacillus sp. A3M-37]|uniref:hypothetical protein n=1 Tax=Domibacillus sp. A3M-37 TaxID=2962037 RepID=UPI0020B6C87E|nr:hypothetical protein [Domibacillus sp. A3M-37]MCP3763751.1 hypothetical protein [Domibacillus sp. A3M-37]
MSRTRSVLACKSSLALSIFVFAVVGVVIGFDSVCGILLACKQKSLCFLQVLPNLLSKAKTSRARLAACLQAEHSATKRP